MSARGLSAVRAVLQSPSSSAFKASDFEAHPVLSPSKVKGKPKSTVFVANAEWGSPYTSAILDALHERTTQEVLNCTESKDKLMFMRRSGSMMQDGHDADLFETETVRGLNVKSSSRTFLVECKHCRRVLLGTRFLEHLRHCSKFKRSQEVLPKRSEADVSLVTSPYASLEKICAEETVSPLEPVVEEVTTANISTLPYFPGTVSDFGAVRKRGFHWQKRLTPLGPIRKARGGRRERQESMALVPLKAITPPKKKQNTAERRALSAAASVGLGSTDDEDKLAFAGGEWGKTVDWAKLMQFCRPVVVPRGDMPRGDIRKNAVARETPLSLYCKVPGGGYMFAETVNSKMVPRNSSQKATRAVTQVTPSLPGALMHVRGKYFNNLQGTDLAKMDITSNMIPKSIYFFHQQSFFANPGIFNTDPKTAADVVLPASITDSTSGGGGTNSRSGANGMNVQQTMTPQQQAATGAAPSTPQEPPTKRQRTSKPRANAQHANQTGAGVPPKQPLPVQRKHAQPRTPQSAGSAATSQKMTNARLQQQIQQQQLQQLQQRQAQLAVGGAAAGTVPVSGMQRGQAQAGQAKRQHYRTPAAAPIPPSAISPSALNPSVLSGGSLSGTAAGKGAVHGNTVNAGTAQAQNMMQRAAGLTPFQPAASKLTPSVNPHGNTGAMTVDYEAMMRASSSAPPTGLNQSLVGVNQELGSLLGNSNKQATSRAASTARAQRPQNANLPNSDAQSQARTQAQLQAQLRAQQAQAQAAQKSQYAANINMNAAAAQQAAMRNFAQPAVASRRPGGAHARQPNVRTSAALSGRSGVVGGGATGATSGAAFPGQQMNVFNPGFSLPMGADRSGNAQGMNAATMAYMQMMQQAGRGGGMQNMNAAAAAAAALQGFAPGMGVQGNMMNMFNAQDGNSNNLTAMAAARMSRQTPPVVPGMMPPEQLMSQFMPNPQQANMMLAQAQAAQAQAAKTAGTPVGTPSASNNRANPIAAQQQALDDIDQALSLGK